MTTSHQHAQGWVSMLKKLAKTAVFTASLGVLAEHLGLASLIAKASMLLMGNMVGGGAVPNVPIAEGNTVVITIGAEHYVQAYRERSPLDRCQLSRDLQLILSKQPEQIAIDIDLSPLERASDAERLCQKGLDELVDAHAEQLVLLQPFEAITQDQRATKTSWMQARCQAQVRFGDGTLVQSLGAVTEMQVAPHGAPVRSLAGLIHQRQAAASSQAHGGIEHLSAPHQVETNPICRELGERDAESTNPEGLAPESEDEGNLQPIHFNAVSKHLALQSIDSPPFKALPSLKGLNVFFGGDWGNADTFLTPYGPLPGVAIHGAMMVSLQHPLSRYSPLWGLLFDLLVGIGFGLLVELAWEKYHEAVVHDAATQETAYSFLVMSVFLVVYAAAIFAVLAVSYALLKYASVITVPLVMATSMLIDGFITGPRMALYEHAGHHISPELAQASHAHLPFKSLAIAARRGRGALYWGIQFAALWLLGAHFIHH